MSHTNFVTVERMLALRPADAKVSSEDAAKLAAIAARLDALFIATGYKGLGSDEDKVVSLWCSDPDDTFGGFDMDIARLGLDEDGVRAIARDLFALLPFEAQVDAVADRFAYLVRDALHDNELAEVIRLNKTPEYSSACATHDYFDSNESMISALAYFGVEFEHDSDTQMALTNAAWNKAKANDFGAEATDDGYLAFLKAFPQTEQNHETGGGCDAWQFDLYRGKTHIGEVLVTTPGDPLKPKRHDTHVTVGVYDLNGDYADGDYHERMPWAEAIAWLQARVAREQSAHTPAMQALIDEYQAKAKREGFLELGDAHEALAATRDYKLRGWLGDFILRWDATEAAENYPETSEAAVFSAALVDILGASHNSSSDHIARVARDALRRVLAMQTGEAANAGKPSSKAQS